MKMGPRSEALSNWKSFLRIDKNKEKLFKCLPKGVVAKFYHYSEVILAYDNLAVRNIYCDLSQILRFINEEADTCYFLHTQNKL